MWLEAVQGMLPIQALQKISCTAEAISTAGHTCGTSGGRGALQQQHLFSLYVHVGSNENIAGFPRESIFYGRVIPLRVKTQWGTHSLTAAIRGLLKEALNDAMNQRFVLLSEWDIPLYPPTVIYVQLMAEQTSRLSACLGPMFKMKPGRWVGSLQNTSFQFQHWRRADTWFALIRRHAEIIVEDRTVEREFAENCQHTDANVSRHCSPRNPNLNMWRECFSEQHYFATLLSFKGFENETACGASLTNSGVDDTKSQMIPLESITAEGVRALRKPDMPACEDRLVMQAAQQQLVHFSGFNTSVCASWTAPYRLHLATACPLLARKFGPETADALTELMKQSEFLSQAKLEQLE
ncbi:hypothetical protein COCSUDRAFT_43360 [Coccomyxa subellipsoidea C-169]|uniref:Uncharacterized protein n=1 Tax=Coccomyxa subellipsoidea (strain C-169) TaxID=574566 RepID=I0YRG4_COCSC|nr:hypothetical protein COCSUDRAFT_43360 [Coccomyxa subellipsoidea C-169]EIE20983.1 hypothetical protein COCSUDRAFT_43360 [Coccomyxa subellipsoidea C-169]|eukprot:XP_005645527.1 hypothetical protein COCSUDRAFT_43360 [Coccomyxa subellipsoidea C-169]